MSADVHYQQNVVELTTSSTDGDNLGGKWDRLLRWLESKGMDTSDLHVRPSTRPDAGRGLTAICDIEPSSPLLNIPYAALMNIRTLQPVYSFLPLEGLPSLTSNVSLDVPPLNGTQLLTLHLCLDCPEGDTMNGTTPEPLFGPYINVLPREFDSHPFSWLLKRREGVASVDEMRLLDLLSPGIISTLSTIADRFSSDAKTIAWYVERYNEELGRPGPLNDSNLGNLLCAWLTVNTRCLYLRLFTEDFEHSNLTLAPIVDFANHASSPNLPSLQPLVLENTNAKKKRVFREIDKFTFCSPLLPVKAKDELFLKYGDHCNKTLFTEYGFVDPGSVGDGEVDVADVVNELIRGTNDSRGDLKRFLEDYGYIQNMCLYGSPKPAYPSWSLLVALRVICDARGKFSVEQTDGDGTPRWLEIASGSYSETCDAAAREELVCLCQTVLSRARDAIAELDDWQTRSVHPPWLGWSCECIRMLWKEEEDIARAVLSNVENKVEF